MLHHAPQRDSLGAGEDGAVAHGEVTLSLVSLPVSPGQDHIAPVNSVPDKVIIRFSHFLMSMITCRVWAPGPPASRPPEAAHW